MSQPAPAIPLLRNHAEQIGKLRSQLEDLFRNLNLIHDLMTVCAHAVTSDQGDCGSEVSRCLELIGGNRLYGQMKILTKIVERLGGETEFTEREATTKAILAGAGAEGSGQAQSTGEPPPAAPVLETQPG